MILGQAKVAYSGPARQTINSDQEEDLKINGLSIEFTPIASDSLIIIKAVIATCATYRTNFRVYKNNQPTVIIDKTIATNISSIYANLTTNYTDDSNTTHMYAVPILWTETSGDTLPRTYDIRAQSKTLGPSLYNLFINNRENNNMASFSYMHVIEFVNT